MRTPTLSPEEAADLVTAYGSVKLAAENTPYTYWQIYSPYRKAVASGNAVELVRGLGIADPDTVVSSADLRTLTDLSEEVPDASFVSPVPVSEVDNGDEEYDKAPFVEPEGFVLPHKPYYRALPPEGKVRRYILTSAQNDTKIHTSFWNNLLAFAEFVGAEVHVARFNYIKRGLGARGDKAELVQGTQKGGNALQWDARLHPYFSDRRLFLAPDFAWCGEMNILPTAVNPLSGLDTYAGSAVSCAIPHTKISMESVATAKNSPTKFNYTTGAVTTRNYIWRKAGLKGDYHHCYGALLVEVGHDGTWFARQINADHDGTFYDLDVKVENERVSRWHTVEAITWGDVHVQYLDPDVQRAHWGEGGMLDTLMPTYQFMHDFLDFRGRNHHETKDPFLRLKRHVDKSENVREEVENSVRFLLDSKRPWCLTVVVDSNHDRAMDRWLKEADWRTDPVNMEFYLSSALARVQAVLNDDSSFLLTHYWAQRMARASLAPDSVRITRDKEDAQPTGDILFLAVDEEFVICPDEGGGIECGMHGDVGANGRRGSRRLFARIGKRSNVGHSHEAGIFEGVYQAGTSSSLDLEYNVGMSSWSHSDIVTYPNGKRTIVTLRGDKWRHPRNDPPLIADEVEDQGHGFVTTIREKGR